MKDSSKKVLISSILIFVLGIALIAILKMPSKTAKFESERTFIFTNNSVASKTNKTKGTKGKNTNANKKNTGENKTTTMAKNANLNTSLSNANNSMAIATKTTLTNSTSSTDGIDSVPGIASLSQRAVPEKAITRRAFDFMFKQFISKLKELNPSSVDRKEVEEFVTEQIDYKVETQYSSSLNEGEERVDSEGAFGEKVTLYKVVYENGVEVERTPISTQITKEPVNKVVTIGTKTQDTTPEPTPTPDTEPDPITTKEPDTQPAPDTQPTPDPETIPDPIQTNGNGPTGAQ